MTDFSLEIPHLTYYLSRILNRYPLGGQILKELLQNAEDSNATEVKFFIDYTDYPNQSLLHPGLSKFQGPALLAYNNSKFEELDFRSIKCIEKSKKYDKPLKIGKFGLGFNSVYHLTDLPSIISGKTVVFFDPHEKYFLKHNNSKEESDHSQQTLIASTFIDFDKSSDDLRLKRDELMTKLNNLINPIDKTMNENTFNMDDIVINYKLSIQTKIIKKETGVLMENNDKYLVSNYVKLKSSSDSLKNLGFKTATFPTCGVAYRLPIDENEDFQNKFKESRYFCFLPMPETIERCGLPIHINGSFGLNDNRRDFKWLSEDAKEEESGRWNQMMVNEVLNKVLIQMIDYSKSLIDANDVDFDIHMFYHLLPNLNNIGFNWKEIRLKAFLNNLTETDLILTQNNKWININNVYLTNKIDDKLDDYAKKNDLKTDEKLELKKSIYECFNPNSLSKTPVPLHVVEIFEQYNKIENLKFIDEFVICNQLRNSSYLSHNNSKIDYKVNLLNFLMQSIIDLKDLNNVQLLPLIDGSFDKFESNSTRKIYYFDQSEVRKLFEEKQGSIVFDDDKLNKLSKIIMVNDLLNNDDNQIIKFNITHFGKMIETILKNGELDNNENNKEWLENIWKFISKNYFDSLKQIENLLLIPRFEPSSKTIQLFTLNKPKENELVKYYYLASDNNQNNCIDLSRETLQFFKDFSHFKTKTNELIGCIFFDKLPIGLEKHPKINEYLNCFGLNSLIECFILLDKCLIHNGMDIKSYINYKMDIKSKKSLIEDLNSIKNIKTSNEFISILKSKIPIFKLYNQDVYCTALECDLFQIDPIFKSDNLPIDPNIKLIDPTSYERLASNLDFVSYPKVDLIEKSITFYAQRIDFNSIKILLEWILLNKNKVFGNNQNFDNFFTNKILSKQIFKNKSVTSNKFYSITEIYDPYNKFVQLFVPIELCLNDDLIKEPFYSNLKNYLLNDINSIYFENYMQKLDNNKNNYSKDDYTHKIRNIFDYLNYLSEKNKIKETEFIVINLAKKIEIFSQNKENNSKTKELSYNLALYLSDYYKNHNITMNEELKYIKWILPKEKPINYSLPWFTEINSQITYKPLDLFSENHQLVLSCVKPLYDKTYSCLTISNDQSSLLHYSIMQFNFLLQFFESNKEKLTSKQIIEIDSFFKGFYLFMQEKTTEEKSINSTELASRIGYFKRNLPTKWIYCPENSIENRFLSIESFAFNVQNSTEPDLIQFPSSYSNDHRSKNFFKTMGVIDNFTIDSLKSKLINIHNKFGSNPLNDQTFNACIKIINEIIYIDDFKKDKISLSTMLKSNDFFLPDENRIMRNIQHLCYDISNTLSLRSDTLDFHVLHQSISYKKFGINSLKNKFFDKIGEPFGQKEDLIDRIKDILTRYSTDSSIFKELIQNADDAKATKISFILDTRSLKTEKTFGYMFNILQGPALCCWNNSKFSEANFKGIISLGQGSKKEDALKIGRFGVGFNCVYHLTDAPQFISDFNDYIIFDPLCKHFPDIEVSNPGCRIRDVKNNFENTIFSDVLSGFEIPGFDLNGSTMFRFPLRTKYSDISTITYDVHRVENLIDKFINSSKECLLFLRNIKEISFYTYSQNGKLKMLNQDVIYLDNNDLLKKESFFNSLDQHIKQTNIINVSKVHTNYFVKTKSLNSEMDFLVFQQFGFNRSLIDSGDKTVNELEKNKKTKFFPLGALAINLDSIEKENFDFDYLLYNYLPLNQKSPLKCHLHGFWALHHENRTHLYEHGLRTDNLDKEAAKWYTDWNLCLINLIICPLYLEMIKLLISDNCLFIKSIPNTLFIKNYLKLFPNISNFDIQLKPYFEKMSKNFYQSIYNLNSIPVSNNDDTITWFKPSDLLFSLNFERQNMNSCNDLCEIIKNARIKICRHNELISLFKDNCEIDLNQINPTNLCEGFKRISSSLIGKNIKESLFKNNKKLHLILIFILTEKKIIDFENLPLLLKENMLLANFSSINQVIFYNNPSIFKGFENLFLHHDFYYMFFNNPNMLDTFFRSISISDLVYLLPCLFNSNEYYLGEKNEQKNYPKLSNEQRKLLTVIWELIEKSIYPNQFDKNTFYSKPRILSHLNLIKNWAIIPVTYGSSKDIYLAPIRDSNEIIYSMKYDFIYDIVRSINFPIFNSKLTNSDKLIQNIIIILSKNEDLLCFLRDQKSKYQILFNKNNTDEFLFYLNNSIKKTRSGYKFEQGTINGLLNEIEIKSLIKSFPIFKDLFDCVSFIENESTLFLLDLIKTSPEIKTFLKSEDDMIKFELKDYSNHVGALIMEYDPELSNLYEYLGIYKKQVEDLYSSFFKWVLTLPKRDHIMFKDHIFYLKTLEIKRLKNNFEFWNMLQTLPFIKINEEFYNVSQCYDEDNRLYQIAFKSLLIPDEYRTYEWKYFLKELGLNTKLKFTDCVKIALRLIYFF